MTERWTTEDLHRHLNGGHVARPAGPASTLTEVRIVLPTPHPDLHPNARPHWGGKSRAVRRAREVAAVACWAACPSRLMWPTAILHAHFELKRRRDPDGLIAWLKAYIDGLQDAGLIENDSRLEIGQPTQGKGKGFVVLTVKKL